MDPHMVTEAIENIRNFRSGNVFKDAAYTYIGKQLLSQKELDHVSRLFKDIDDNGDGKISYEEFRVAVNRLVKVELSEEEG